MKNALCHPTRFWNVISQRALCSVALPRPPRARGRSQDFIGNLFCLSTLRNVVAPLTTAGMTITRKWGHSQTFRHNPSIYEITVIMPNKAVIENWIAIIEMLPQIYQTVQSCINPLSVIVSYTLHKSTIYRPSLLRHNRMQIFTFWVEKWNEHFLLFLSLTVPTVRQIKYYTFMISA